MFLLFKDTFRRERSLAYQAAVHRLRLRQSVKNSRHKTSEEKSRSSEDHEETDDHLNSTKAIGLGSRTEETSAPDVKDIRLSLADVNPFPQIYQVAKRKNNIVMYFPSALLFALSYSISYTCSKTLFAPPYNYDALRVGLVLLSFGVGSMCGSLLGGRWSDRVLSRLKKANGGTGYPEMRLKATKLAMPILPASILAYAWMADKHIHIAGIVVALFFVGLSSIWIYSSTLAYIVDANVGRSSTAVATNSFSRGLAGFIAAEAAVPLQNAIGDGGLYTIWAVLCILLDLVILLVIAKGASWREASEEKERTGTHSGY